MRKKEVDSAIDKVNKGLITIHEAGGHFADSILSSTSDGNFLLVPKRHDIVVLGSRSADTVFEIQAIHQGIGSVICRIDLASDTVDGGKRTTESFVSVDTFNFVYIWELTYNTKKDGSSNKFKWKQITSFHLTQLHLPSPQDQSSELTSAFVRRIAIRNCHVVSGSSQTLETASVVLIIESQIFTKDATTVSPLSDDSKTDDDGVPTAGSENTFAEVVSISIGPLFRSGSFSPLMWRFACGFEFVKKRRVAKGGVAIRSAVTASGSFIAVSVAKRITIWNDATRDVIELAHTDCISAMTFSPDETYLVTGDANGKILWWKALNTTSFSGGFTTPRVNSAGKERIDSSGAVRAANLAVLKDARSSLVEQVSAFLYPGNSNSTVKRTFKIDLAVQRWHVHAVKGLCFAADRVHLISGGEEGVLVFWHVDQTTRQFMPRLGAPIHGLFALKHDPLVCATLGNNSLTIVDVPTHSSIGLYEGLQVPLPLLQTSSLRPTAIIAKTRDYLPITLQCIRGLDSGKVMVTGSGVTHAGLGPNSTLQIYDTEKDQSDGSLRVNQTHFVSRVDWKLKQTQWTVQKAAMSPDCRQMATVEFRPCLFKSTVDIIKDCLPRAKGAFGLARESPLEEFGTPQINEAADYGSRPPDVAKRLRNAGPSSNICADGAFDDRIHGSGCLYEIKFWELNQFDSKEFFKHAAVVTSIEHPHLHHVTSLVCVSIKSSSSKNIRDAFDFVTSSLDSTWRVWRRHAVSDSVAYVCVHTGTYRSLPVLNFVINSDASLSAAGHPTCISLWKSEDSSHSPPVTGEHHLATLPIPQLCGLPETEKYCLQWIECAITVDYSAVGGEVLLLCSNGSHLWLWDIKEANSHLVWFMKLQDSPAILLPTSWYLPMFSVACPAEGAVRVFEVQRLSDNTIDCQLIESISTKQKRRLLGCTVLGGSEGAKVVLLDSDFQLSCHPLRRKNSSDLESIATTSATLSRLDDKTSLQFTESDSDVDEDIPDLTVVEGQSSPTHFLSNYLLKIHPPLSFSSTDIHSINRIVGQSADGASHFAPLPSTMFRNLVEVYTYGSKKA